MGQHPPINWLAVLVAGLVIFALGALWYSRALFAKPWIALQGRTEEQMKADAANANMPLMLGSVFVSGLVTALGLALVLAHVGDRIEINAGHGAIVGFGCWLAFAATTSYGMYLFSMRPLKLWLIDTGYNLVAFVIAGIILAVWR